MTYAQAQSHIDNLLDKTGTAYFTPTEKNQFIDWRKRPLEKEKILYAINDVKYLPKLFLKAFFNSLTSAKSAKILISIWL